MGRDLGPLLVGLGVLLVVVGALAWAGGLSWFGHLPGDIRIEREHGTFFFPVTSMIIVSVVLTLLVNLFFRH